jgi:hypothetical protein
MAHRHEGHDGGAIKFSLKIGDAFDDERPALAEPEPQEADWELAE